MGLWNVLSPLSFLALPPCIHPAHQPTCKPNHLLSTVKSSFMMYLQPLLNLHSCHCITDSRSHHLNVRYYEKSHKWSPCLLCFSLSRILHASEGPIFLKYCSGNQPKITLDNILNIHTSRLSTICSKSVFLALVPSYMITIQLHDLTNFLTLNSPALRTLSSTLFAPLYPFFFIRFLSIIQSYFRFYLLWVARLLQLTMIFSYFYLL